MKVVVLSASPRKEAKTQFAMRVAYEHAKASYPETTFINMAETPIDCYRGFGESYSEVTMNAAKAIMEADVWIIGTPIYNSFFSSALKNIFEYVDYKKTAGKVAGMAIVASGEIGFNNVQTLLTQLLSYFGVITNPTAVYLTADKLNADSVDEKCAMRIKEMVDKTLELATKIR